MSDREQKGYVVPCYAPAEGEPWLHFLHGNVPGHQIDFMYRPQVPEGALTQQHFSHLARLMRYIEPHNGRDHAFTVGNLSRDDTQHEPGHGGVALIFGLRIRGACDHAGRPDPPFSHAVATVDSALDAATLFAAATTFHRHVLGEAASAEWYRSYVRAGGEPPESIARVLESYVAGFGDLPRPAPSTMSLAWSTGGGTKSGRVVFVYPDDAPFEILARAAARLAAVLYRSDVRWSAISSGREADLPNGLSIRFLAESAIGRGDPAAALHTLAEIPEDDEAIARELFGARPVSRSRPVAIGWRERRAAEDGEIVSSVVGSDPEIHVTFEAPRSSTRPLRPITTAETPEPPVPLVLDELTPDLTTPPACDDPGSMGEACETGDSASPPEAAAAPSAQIEDAPTPEVSVEDAPAIDDDPTPVPTGDEDDLVETAVAAPIAPSREPDAKPRAPDVKSDPPPAALVRQTPLPLAPIPVPLPLVSPPPVSEPRRDPPPAAARPRTAAVVAACLLAGLAATLYVVFAHDTVTPTPEATAITVRAPATPAKTSTERVNTPPPPAAHPPAKPAKRPSPGPAAPPSSTARKPARVPRPSSTLCGVRNGKPCF